MLFNPSWPNCRSYGADSAEKCILMPLFGMVFLVISHLRALDPNAATAMAFFRLPPNRVIELGSQIEI